MVQGYRHCCVARLRSKPKTRRTVLSEQRRNIKCGCPEAADWSVEKQAVALIVNGGFATCTGSMINNTANDGTPYFLTANHCLGTPNTWTYYFNHESATCSGSTGPTNNSISGGSLLVNNGGSDVALIQLSSAPPASWGVEYAGWDASSAAHSRCGHPPPFWGRKKICFENNALTPAPWWCPGLVDQPMGSRVSRNLIFWFAFFNQDHRIIGQLYEGGRLFSTQQRAIRLLRPF